MRFNLPFIRPVLEMPSFPFQLILAASVIAMLRTVVGIRTLGVFGPTIFALGLISVGSVWGTVLYLDIFILAILATFALYPLALDESRRVKIQNRQRYLEIACMAQAASRLGYAGVDIVPTTGGPLVLEVNKRPGLEIQASAGEDKTELGMG